MGPAKGPAVDHLGSLPRPFADHVETLVGGQPHPAAEHQAEAASHYSDCSGAAEALVGWQPPPDAEHQEEEASCPHLDYHVEQPPEAPDLHFEGLVAIQGTVGRWLLQKGGSKFHERT